MNLIKNISKSEVHVLKDQVTYQEGQVVSKTLAQNDAVSITLFAFDKDEAISTCLLYTSPSPRDGLLSRMPSSA